MCNNICNKISVITPSFNQGKFIERTIKSVLMQNIPNLEYWVIDGGSTDETVNILKHYDDELKWVSERDNGQSEAINKGLQRVSGDIIGWLNSDDIYYPSCIRKVCDFFEQFKDVDIVYGDAYYIDENDFPIELYYTEACDIKRLKSVCYLCQPAVFFRRNVIERFGLINESLQYCMDYEYWLRLALGGAKFAYLPKILAGSRLHPDTKTVGSRLEVSKEINDMLRQVLGKVPARWISNYAHVRLEKESFRNRNIFIFRLILLTLHSSIRWNRSISKDLLALCMHWLVRNIRIRLR